MIVGVFHVLIGVRGDWIVGIDPPTQVDASLDSQNRFYGAVFVSAGSVLVLGLRDLFRYAPAMKMVIAAVFVGGLARGLAMLASGWPTKMIMVLWSLQLLLPPVAWLWLNQQLSHRMPR